MARQSGAEAGAGSGDDGDPAGKCFSGSHEPAVLSAANSDSSTELVASRTTSISVN